MSHSDSASGLITNYQIAVHEIELRHLVGGEQFVTKCLIYFNGIAFQLNALIDCGANGYAFIDQKKAKELQKKIYCLIKRLVQTIPVTSFNDNQAKGIQQITQANIYIDGRVITQCPFLELDINQYNIILGRRWLAYHDVMPDC